MCRRNWSRSTKRNERQRINKVPSHFDSIFEELSDLQSRLTLTVNRLWFIKSSLASATRRGHLETDFLPRRLISLEGEAQEIYQKLLHKLRWITSHFDSALIAFNSVEDVKTVLKIRKTIRYIQNAFAGEIPLAYTLARLNRVLPASSTH